MEGSVLSFLKAEWKVSDTGSAHWASSLATTNNKMSYLIYNNSIESAIKTYNMSIQWIALELILLVMM